MTTDRFGYLETAPDEDGDTLRVRASDDRAVVAVWWERDGRANSVILAPPAARELYDWLAHHLAIEPPEPEPAPEPEPTPAELRAADLKLARELLIARGFATSSSPDVDALIKLADYIGAARVQEAAEQLPTCGKCGGTEGDIVYVGRVSGHMHAYGACSTNGVIR